MKNLGVKFKKRFTLLHQSILLYILNWFKEQKLLKDIYDAKKLEQTKIRMNRRANRHLRVLKYGEKYKAIEKDLFNNPPKDRATVPNYSPVLKAYHKGSY